MHGTALDRLPQALELETRRFAVSLFPGAGGIVETR